MKTLLILIGISLLVAMLFAWYSGFICVFAYSHGICWPCFGC